MTLLGQTAFLDERKPTQLRLDNGRGLDASTLGGTLYVQLIEPLPGTHPPDNIYPLIASDVAIDASGRQVGLAFPSLARLGIGISNLRDAAVVVQRQQPRRYDLSLTDQATAGQEQTCRAGQDTHRAPGGELGPSTRRNLAAAFEALIEAPPACDSDCLACAAYRVAYQPLLRPEELPGFTVASVVDRVVASNNAGSVSLIVKLAKQGPRPDTIVLDVKNGRLQKASPVAIQGPPADFSGGAKTAVTEDKIGNTVKITQPADAMNVTVELDQLYHVHAERLARRGGRRDAEAGRGRGEGGGPACRWLQSPEVASFSGRGASLSHRVLLPRRQPVEARGVHLAPIGREPVLALGVGPSRRISRSPI